MCNSTIYDFIFEMIVIIYDVHPDVKMAIWLYSISKGLYIKFLVPDTETTTSNIEPMEV